MALYQKNIHKYRKNSILTVLVIGFFTLVLILLSKGNWVFWIFLMIILLIYFFYENFQKLVGEIEIRDNEFRLVYYNYKKEIVEIETSTSSVETYLINNSSRNGFDASLQLTIEGIELYLKPNRGWNFEEMREILLQITAFNNDEMDDKEKFTLERLNKKIAVQQKTV